MSMVRGWFFLACAVASGLLAGCPRSSTTVMATISGPVASLNLSSFTAEVTVDQGQTVTRPLTTGMVTLPQTVLIVLPVVTANVNVKISAETVAGDLLHAVNAVTSVPHQQAGLELVLEGGGLGNDGGTDAGGV